MPSSHRRAYAWGHRQDGGTLSVSSPLAWLLSLSWEILPHSTDGSNGSAAPMAKMWTVVCGLDPFRPPIGGHMGTCARLCAHARKLSTSSY